MNLIFLKSLYLGSNRKYSLGFEVLDVIRRDWKIDW